MSPIKSCITISVIIVFLAFFLGCSGGVNNSHPITPIPEISSLSNIPGVGVSDWNSDGSPSAGMGLVGLYSGYVDAANLNGEVIPLRGNSLTDVLEVVDITNFLQLAPCTDCVKLKSIALDPDGNVVATIGIKHPFPPGDPLKPITGRNRADLHVFNIEGIVISNYTASAFPSIGESAAGFKLLSADGYTSYLDASLDAIYPTDATIHPYVLHFDDYSVGNFDPSNPMGFQSVTTPPPSGNLVMAMGCEYNYQDYVLALTDRFDFIFAVGCTYAVSAATKSQRFQPEFRIPQHNKKAASEVTIEFITNELRGGIISSSAQVQVRVVDVSHGVAVGSALNEMLSDSSVGQISIEIPGITASPVLIDGGSPTSGTGHDPSDPLIYDAVITNSAGGPEGSYPGLIKVTDTYQPGQNTAPLLNGMDGIKRVSPIDNPLTGLFNIDEFVTYQVFWVNVNPGCGPITGSITNPQCPLSGVSDDQYIGFTALASSANGGDPIVLYEWDMNYDGIPANFNVDATGSTVNLGPFDNPTCGTPNEEPVDYLVAVRATDSCVPPNITIFATCTVTVDICDDPFKNIPLRAEAWDLAVDRLDGRVLIIYKDGQVWQYLKDNLYQAPTPNQVYYDSDWFNTVIYNTSRQPTSYSCVPIKAFLAISDNHYFVLSYFWYVYDWVDRSWYDVVNDQGIKVSHIVPKGNWAVSYSLFEAMAFGAGGDHPNHMGVTWSTSVPGSWVYFSHSSPSNNYQTEQYAYRNYSTSRLGVDVYWPGYVTGLEVDENESAVWVVENIDYYASRWRFNNGTSASYAYDNAYFGTGVATDADNGFNSPLDLTRTSDNRMLVLDRHSNGTSYRVKAFNVASSPGTPAGTLEISGLTGPIKRIDCGEWVDPTNGNMLFVLHGDTTNGWFLSIYRESELPW